MGRYLGLKKEGTYGDAEAGASTRYEDTIGSITPNPNWIVPEPVSQRGFQKRALGLYRSRGTIGDFDVTPNGIIGDLLLGVLGGIDTATPSSGVKTHTFKPAKLIPSFTARMGVELMERVIPGLLVDALTLRFEAGEAVKCSADVVSGFPETKNDINESFTIDTLQPITQKDEVVNVTWDGDAEAGVYISSLELRIENNIPFDRGDLSGRTFSKLRVGQRVVSGTLTAYFDNQDLYDKFIVGDEFSFLVTVGQQILKEANEDPAFHYIIGAQASNCQYMEDSTPNLQTQNEPLMVNAPFRCFNAGIDTNEIEAILQNDIDSY